MSSLAQWLGSRLEFRTSLVRILLHGVMVFSPHLFLRAYITSYISVETSRVSWKLGSFDDNGSYFKFGAVQYCRFATLAEQQLFSHSSVLLQNQNLHSPFCIQPCTRTTASTMVSGLSFSASPSLCKRVVWCKDIALCPLLRDKVFSVVVNHVVNSTMSCLVA